MKNTYEITKVLQGGADKIGSDIHGLTIKINQMVWDIIKVLNQEEYEDFHVVANVSTKKTIIVLYHKNIKIAKEAKKVVEKRIDCSEFLMMTRVKKKKKSRFSKRVILVLLIAIALLTFIAYILINELKIFEKEEQLFSKHQQEKVLNTVPTHNNIVKVELDMEKIKLLQDTFIEQKSDLQKNIIKTMETSVSIISMLVPQSEKEKYNIQELAKNFKEKGGIEFVLKNPKNSSTALKELNAYAIDSLDNDKEGKLLKAYQKLIEHKVTKETKENSDKELKKIVATLDDYAKEMTKDQNSSEFIKKYQKILDENSSLKDKMFLNEFFKQKDVNKSLQKLNAYIQSTPQQNKISKKLQKRLNHNRQKIDKKELINAYSTMGTLYKNHGDLDKSKLFYEESLTLSQNLLDKDELLSLSAQAYNLVKISHIENEFKHYPLSKKQLQDAEEMYLKIVSIYRKLSLEKKELKERLAGALNTLANFYHGEMLNYKASVKIRKDALKIYEELLKEDTALYTRVVYQTKNSLAESYIFLNEFSSAKKLYVESLKLIDKKIAKNKKKNDIFVAALIHHDIAWVELFMKHFDKGKKEIREMLNSTKVLKERKKELRALGYFYLAYSAYIQEELDESLEYIIKSLFFIKSFKTDKFYLSLLIEKRDDKEINKVFKNMLKYYKRYDQQEELKMQYVNYKILKKMRNLKVIKGSVK